MNLILFFVEKILIINKELLKNSAPILINFTNKNYTLNPFNNIENCTFRVFQITK